MTDVQLVQPNGNDYQWKVEESEARQYRVELNVLTNKIKFEKEKISNPTSADNLIPHSLRNEKVVWNIRK